MTGTSVDRGSGEARDHLAAIQLPRTGPDASRVGAGEGTSPEFASRHPA